MNTILTNLSNDLYSESRLRLNESAKMVGITQIDSYDFSDLKGSTFYCENKEILDQPRAVGYWLWKPYLILEAFKKISDGDIVVYSDCGIEIISSLDPLIRIVEESSILLFGNANEINRTWTKRDCFYYMDCDAEKYWDSPHVDAAFCLFKKSDLAIKFVSDWLKFGSNKHIITDIPNICGLDNLTGYREHRRDQSILSLLAQKYELDLFRMPTQFGNHYKSHKYRKPEEHNCISQVFQNQVKFYAFIPYYNSSYFQLLDHHRSKSNTSTTPEVVVKNQYIKNNFRTSSIISFLKRRVDHLIRS